MLHAHRTALLRVLALLIALTAMPLASGTTDASSPYLANCTVNVRSKPWTSAWVRKVIPADTTVTVAEKVSGGSWKADCATSVSGSSWFKITAIGGHSVSSLFGVAAVYAASGLFRSGGYVSGIDVSHWNGWIDFAKVKASGTSFVIAKASEGNTYTDSYYTTNRRYAMANGLKFAGYHFARPNGGTSDAVSEADHFVAALHQTHGMLYPVLDIEHAGTLGTSALQGWVKAFAARVRYRLGVKVMIYTNASFWRYHMGNTTWFADNGYKLWIAHWGVTAPSTPASSWGGHGWTFWQNSSCGSVRGVSGCVDLDRFRGSFKAVTY